MLIYEYVTYTYIFHQQLCADELSLLHLAPGGPVFWFSAAQNVPHRLGPVSKLCVTGLRQVRTEIESKHLDTQEFDTPKSSMPMFIFPIPHLYYILQYNKYSTVLVHDKWQIKKETHWPFTESVEKFAGIDTDQSFPGATVYLE